MYAFTTAAMIAALVGVRSSVGAAADALFSHAYSPADDPPGFWDLIARILSAFADIINAWPGGVPLNAKDVLLAVFRAAAIEELAPKIDELMRSLLIAPSLSETVWFTFIILAIAPGFVIMLIRSIEYFHATGKLHEDEEDQWWQGEHPDYVPLPAWGGRFLVTFLVLGSFAFLIGGIIATAWDMMFSFVGMFYDNTGTSFGASVVDILLRIIAGTNPIEFILSFAFGMLILLWVGIVYFKRFLAFFFENVKLPVRMPQIMSGRREVNFATQTEEYLESFGLLALTTIAVLLGPLLIGDIMRLTGLWAIAGLFFVCWVIVDKIPELWQNTRIRTLIRRIPSAVFGEEDLFTQNKQDTKSPVPASEPDSPEKRKRRKTDLTNLARELDPKNFGEAEKIAKTVATGSVATILVQEWRQRQQSSRQPTAKQADPDLEFINSIPEELLQRMEDLDPDEAMNAALFARLTVFYRANTPLLSFDEVLEDLKIVLEDVRQKDPERFESYVKAGKRLMEKAKKARREEENG